MRMFWAKDEGWFILILLHVAFYESASAFYLSSSRQTKVINETFLVTCKDGNNSVTWSGPKGPLSSNTRPQVRISKYGTSIVFNQTVPSDSGVYVCSNQNGRREYHLTVETPLEFKGIKSPVKTGNEFSDVLLPCEVKDGKTSWTKNGSEITDERFIPTPSGLLIKNATRHDSTTYICTAVKERTGAIAQQEIELKIHHKPTFRYPHYAKQEQAYSFIGSIVNLTCEAYSEPPPKFEWSRKGRKSIDGRFIQLDRNTSILQIKVDKHSFGNYVCNITNKLGVLEKIFSLEPGVQPYPPEYVKFLGANSDLIELEIQGPNLTDKSMPSNMETTGYRVEYRPRETEDDFSFQDFDKSEDDRYSLRNLSHNTEYEVRAATRNPAGLSEFTNVSIFWTVPSESDSVHSNLPSVYIAVNFLVGILTTYALLW